MMVLTLFVGLRYKVGNDYKEYFIAHGNFKEGETNYFEPLFSLLNLITITPYEMFFWSAVISFIFLYFAIRYFEPNNSIFVITMYFGIYLIIFNIHIIRQGIAIAIILFAFRYIVENKFFKYIIFVFIAMGFHSSSFIALPIYFFAKINLRVRNKFIILGISLLSLGVLYKFGDFVFNLIGFVPFLSRYAEVYRDNNYSSFVPFSLGMIMNIILFIAVQLFVFRSHKQFNRKESILLNIFYISVILSIVLRYSAIFLRLNYFFQISNIFMFVLIIGYFNNTKYRLVIKLIFLFITVMYLYQNLTTGHAIVRYRTIFQI